MNWVLAGVLGVVAALGFGIGLFIKTYERNHLHRDEPVSFTRKVEPDKPISFVRNIP